jgi:hypothetical protein
LRVLRLDTGAGIGWDADAGRGGVGCDASVGAGRVLRPDVRALAPCFYVHAQLISCLDQPVEARPGDWIDSSVAV